jgi:diamine N-acetyltransferase
MSAIEFKEISLSNLDEIIKLEVSPQQTELVADNLYSIAQTGLDPSGWCRGIYRDGQPVGFLFVKELEAGSVLYLCRFMIDQNHQGKGFGRKAMQQLLALIFSSTAAKVVDLAVSKSAGNAEEFYRKWGFTPTGEVYRAGWRMVLSRSDYLP